jgi:hypothetical protein
MVEPDELMAAADIIAAARQGRVTAVNGYPTGVEVSDAMVHSGPYPATSEKSRDSVTQDLAPAVAMAADAVSVSWYAMLRITSMKASAAVLGGSPCSVISP